jgi:hypothetical protein
MEMPTIAELKARLKSMNIKGVAKKNKAELMAMLEGSPVPARDRTPVAMSPRGASHLATAMNRLLGRGTGGAPPMSDALAKLREVEAATKGRNEARAAARAAAPVAAGGAGGPPPKAKAASKETSPAEVLRKYLMSHKDKFELVGEDLHGKRGDVRRDGTFYFHSTYSSVPDKIYKIVRKLPSYVNPVMFFRGKYVPYKVTAIGTDIVNGKEVASDADELPRVQTSNNGTQVLIHFHNQPESVSNASIIEIGIGLIKD